MVRRAKLIRLSPGQAKQAIDVLIHEGKLLMRDVLRAVKRRQRRIAELRQELAALESGAIAGRVAGPRRDRKRVAKRRRRLSREARKNLQLQGKYMAALRGVPKSSRAKIKAMRARSGVQAAIAAAKKMAAA